MAEAFEAEVRITTDEAVRNLRDLERELGELRRVAGHFLDPPPDGLKAGFVDLRVFFGLGHDWPPFVIACVDRCVSPGWRQCLSARHAAARSSHGGSGWIAHRRRCAPA